MRYVGTTVRGIRTPIIKENDDLATIVVDSLMKAKESEGFEFRDKDVVAITEAVVGISEGNYVTVDDIALDIKNKFPSKNIGVVFPILSRNRFSMILKGIARGMDKITMLLSFPSDEVGNGILDEDIIGMEVYGENNLIGTVTDILKNKVHSILVIEKDGNKNMIPYVDEFIKNIDLENKKIEINVIEGLINEN